VRITLRPNGYAICALLAGTLVGGALLAPERNWLELLALWVLVDLALGAFYTGLVHLVGLLPLADDRRGAVPAELIPAIGGAGLALLIATGLGEPVAYLTQAALALGVVIALTAGRSPHREAAPMLTGLQVLIAWTLGFVQATHWQSPLLALGLVAAIGTWTRCDLTRCELTRCELTLSPMAPSLMVRSVIALALMARCCGQRGLHGLPGWARCWSHASPYWPACLL
jgi:hypothetical protein